MQKKLSSFFLLVFVLLTTPLQAASIQGYVRSVNHEGHSFSVDLPPLQRVWVSPATQFESGKGYEAFRSIQEGDRVIVEGNLQGNGVFAAHTVKKLQPSPPSKGSMLTVELNQSFLLEVNQKAKLKNSELTLQGIEMVDTLCKEGLNCEGEGSIGMRIHVQKGGQKKDLLLSSPGGRKPVHPVVLEALGYQIELIEVGESVAMLVLRK